MKKKQLQLTTSGKIILAFIAVFIISAFSVGVTFIELRNFVDEQGTISSKNNLVSLEDLKNNVVTLKITLITFLVVQGAVMLIIGFYLDRKLGKKYELIHQGIKDLTTKRQREEKLELEKNDEYGRLASALNEALDKIEHREKKYEQKNIELESAALKSMSILDRKRDLFHQIAHDVKTPLTPIVSSLQIIQLTSKEKKTIDLADNAIKNANYLNTLLNETLELERLDNDKILINKKLQPIQTVMDHILSLYSSTFLQENITIQKNFHCNPHVDVDYLRIQEVFRNIITNAMQFLDKSEKILLFTISCKDSFVEVAITDNGKGMDEETAKHVFEEFYQADSSRHHRTFGLGLAISQRIIFLHDGQIKVHSEGPGKGTTMSILLPIDPNEDTTYL